MNEQQGYSIAESEQDFQILQQEGWVVVYNEHYKDGVRRVWMRKEINGAAAYMNPIYAKQEYTNNIIEGE